MKEQLPLPSRAITHEGSGSAAAGLAASWARKVSNYSIELSFML
jgi:hypothetical protein